MQAKGSSKASPYQSDLRKKSIPPWAPIGQVGTTLLCAFPFESFLFNLAWAKGYHGHLIQQVQQLDCHPWPRRTGDQSPSKPPVDGKEHWSAITLQIIGLFQTSVLSLELSSFQHHPSTSNTLEDIVGAKEEGTIRKSRRWQGRFSVTYPFPIYFHKHFISILLCLFYETPEPSWVPRTKLRLS